MDNEWVVLEDKSQMSAVRLNSLGEDTKVDWKYPLNPKFNYAIQESYRAPASETNPWKYNNQ